MQLTEHKFLKFVGKYEDFSKLYVKLNLWYSAIDFCLVYLLVSGM
jgi:hypothetical protein